MVLDYYFAQHVYAAAGNVTLIPLSLKPFVQFEKFRMLSRGNSTASNRLRRAKSSSFAQSAAHRNVIEPQTMDPLTARQQAVAAASHAFEHGQGGQWQTSAPSPVKNNEKGLGRRQSVRFAGPNATDTRDIQITKRVAPMDNASNDGHRGSVPVPHMFEEAQPRWSETYLSKSQISQEDYAGFRISSLPSSYQKLRKSKSMFNPRNYRPAILTGGSTQESAQTNRAHPAPNPRLRRSFSFVRDSDNTSIHADQHNIQDLAIQIARDKFLRQAENQPSEDDSYSLPSGKTQKIQKAFRRTVRTSSTNSYGTGVVSATTPVADRITKRGFGNKARSLSVSLKNRLKRVFSRTPDAEEALPVQQVDAGRLHFGDSISPSSGVDEQYHPVPSPDQNIVRNTISRESILIDIPKLLDKPSNPGSIRSVRSDDDISNTRSRATSWTNSTATNTITSNQTKEKKRLSIIQENGGPYQPSSPIRHYGDLGSLFHQPFRSNSVGARAGIDSRRIYSAIQKRIDERKRNGPWSEENETATEKGRENDGFQPFDIERVSLSSRIMANTSQDTTVQRERMRKSAELASTAVVSDSLIPAKEGLIDQSYQRSFISMPIGLTPQQIAERNESGTPSPKRPLREVKSTFFPSSTRIERSNTSPYRRAMHRGVEEDYGTDPVVKSYEYIGSNGSPLRRIMPGSDRIRNTARTESIYSRTSSGNTPKPEKSSLSVATPAASLEAGTAVIITTRTKNYDQPLSPSRQRSNTSLRSSVDRQQLMASPFASESPGDENKRVPCTSISKENGLTKVNAQIHGDDVHFGGLVKAHTESPKRPLGAIKGNSVSPRPVLKSENSQPMNDRFPLFGKSCQPAQSNLNEQYGPSTSDSYPVTSMRRWSQADYEKYASGRKGVAAAEKRLSAPLESPSSNAEIRRGHLMACSTNTTVDSPSDAQPLSRQLRGLLELKQKGKYKARNSPERIARLRRMQSTPNSLGADQLTIKALSRESDGVLGNRYHLQEKENILIGGQSTPTKDRRSSGNDIVSGDNLDGGGSAGEVDLDSQLDSRKLVDTFLSDRRREMGVNEDNENETAADAVFL